ncbi:potassium channel family protein [Pseudoclavibacter helvolus]|uniref:potassium channel family protein n=1 Tax=Pseudoclavibacter helvolus TaxID=255205 RepID=UPI000A93B44C|nr:TrkA family potassium uptake protein [Pseudoclavibacter helvolus]
MAKNPFLSGRDLTRIAEADSVAVIGLGRFGQALALELMAKGTEVLGIDRREDIVQRLNGQLTHVVAADATSEEVLQQLTVPSFDRVVVAIGDDLEASILTTSLLLRFGIQHVWAKAVSDAHGTILEQLGVTHVVYPEKEMGKRVAHLVRGAMQDYIEIGDDFALVTAAANQTVSGVPLGEARIRSKYGVTITAVKKPGAHWSYTTADTVIDAGDLMLIAGQTQKAEAFSQLR